MLKRTRLFYINIYIDGVGGFSELSEQKKLEIRFKAFERMSKDCDNIEITGPEYFYQPENAFCLAYRFTFIGRQRLLYYMKDLIKSIFNK